MRLTGTLVLVLSVLAFAGSAYAGNGNGNGKGNEGAAPGNSGNAPGQVKKDEPAAAPAPAAGTTTTVTAPPQTTTAANASGVKPSNNTAHDTHAQAQSDKTKQYGNGQTAGQIAERNGAAGTDVLHGPGNSQPHKVTPCSGGRHEVDVHALKSHRARNCGDPAPHPNPVPKPNPDPGPPPAVTTTATTPKTSTTAGSSSSTTTTQTTPAGHQAAGQSAGSTEGVLSATQRVGHVATLPFTGQRLWLVALLGVILIVTGLALREIRTEEAPVESGHDHTDRSRHAAHGSGASLGGRPGR
jgi:hypothetical protein